MRMEQFFPLSSIAGGKAAAEVATLRQRCVELAQYLNIIMPDSLEKSAAIEHLRETYEWGRGGILERRRCRGQA